jgi:hypothetical protein
VQATIEKNGGIERRVSRLCGARGRCRGGRFRRGTGMAARGTKVALRGGVTRFLYCLGRG